MLILASSSPRRRALLNAAGWSFKAMPADIDEQLLPVESAQAYVLRLAKEKAQFIQQNLDGDASEEAVIIAADTTVVMNEQILGKPADAFEAENMLRGLQGKTHQVYTGLIVLRVADHCLSADLTSTSVTMRDYTDMEIFAYIATGDPIDKAGAYAIQHQQFHPVEAIDDCYGNVVGLPVCKLNRMLNDIGLQSDLQASLACPGVGSGLNGCAVADYFNGKE